jgi:hypothetical protein
MATKLTRSEFAQMVLNHDLAREYIYKGEDTYETATDLYCLAFVFPQKYTREYGLEVHHYRAFYKLMEEFGCTPIYAEEIHYMDKRELEAKLNSGEFHLVDEDKLLIMSTSASCCTNHSIEDEMSKRTLLSCFGIKTTYYRVGLGTCCQIISNTWYETPANRLKCTHHCTHPPGIFPSY